MKKIPRLLLILLLVSCAPTVNKISKEKPLFEVLTQQEYGGGSFRFFEILTENNEIKMLQNDPDLKHKISAEDVQNSNFVILNMGEKQTGGYAISVENVEETDNNIILTVKEINPDKNAMVTQGITYPFCVVKINSKKEIIIK